MAHAHMTRSDWLRLAVVAIVAIVALVLLFYPPRPMDEVIRLGLDLQGGIRLLLEPEGIQELPSDRKLATLDSIIPILADRIDQFGLANAEIKRLGTERILINLPGAEDPAEARKLIGQTAVLTFHKVVEAGTDPTDELTARSVLHTLMRNREGVPFIVEREPVLRGSALEDAAVRISRQLATAGDPYIELQLNADGARQFGAVMRSMDAGDRLAIVLDDAIYSAPVITEDIKQAAEAAGARGIETAQISNIPSQEEANRLAIVLRTGALPVAVTIVQEDTVGPTLGSDSIRRGMITIIAGFLIILVYMLLYYRVLGIVADIALVLNMLIVFAALVLFRATLTLPGIAGIILTIGMTVDANVIIFERIKEEMRTGKSPLASVRAGFEKSLSTLLDANITTVLTAVVLLFAGTGPVKGFAITLMIGVIGSLFCALVATRLLLEKTNLSHHVPVKRIAET
ncbi:MAG: protein translocase subunit SecD [Candidatus Bipolaricaulota bacterium]|nr:MAG: protein translocase subunit SecD [Candidatus Bipolaricaulota bacterium]